jgi:hypothetical protein
MACRRLRSRAACWTVRCRRAKILRTARERPVGAAAGSGLGKEGREAAPEACCGAPSAVMLSLTTRTKSIALPLPLLPEAHGQHLRHRRLLSRPGRHHARPLQPLYASVRQRFSRDLSLLSRLRLDGVLETGTPARANGGCRRRVCGSNVPEACECGPSGESAFVGGRLVKGLGGRPLAHPRTRFAQSNICIGSGR